MRAAAVSAKGLHYARGVRPILRDVDVSVGAGEHVALLGPSGCGKTTLLSILAGLATPDAGTVCLDGHPLTRADTSAVALVLQGYGLLTLLTAAENLVVTLRARGVRPRTALARTHQALAELHVADHADHLVEELSGGQQQRVAVARALALRPRLLLADEPTAEQDAGHRAAVTDALLGRPRDLTTVLLATHDDDTARRCDRIIHLRGTVLGDLGARRPSSMQGAETTDIRPSL